MLSLREEKLSFLLIIKAFYPNLYFLRVPVKRTGTAIQAHQLGGGGGGWWNRRWGRCAPARPRRWRAWAGRGPPATRPSGPGTPRSARMHTGEEQGCGSGPFSAGSGSSKSEFSKPAPDPIGTYQDSIKTSIFFTSNIFLLIFE